MHERSEELSGMSETGHRSHIPNRREDLQCESQLMIPVTSS